MQQSTLQQDGYAERDREVMSLFRSLYRNVEDDSCSAVGVNVDKLPLLHHYTPEFARLKEGPILEAYEEGPLLM